MDVDYLSDGLHVHNWCKTVLDDGKRPRIIVLEKIEPTDDVNDKLNEAERAWIGAMKLAGHRLTNLNEGGGGQLGFKHSEESKRKMSESSMGQIAWNKGKITSDEVRVKQSLAHAGNRHSVETRRKMSESRMGLKNRSISVVCLDDGKKFDCMKDASDHYCISASSVTRSVRDGSRVANHRFVKA